jgi:hypothetical protein
MELGEGGEGVEDVEHVDGQVLRLAALLLEQASQQAHQRLVLDQRLEVLGRARQLQYLRGGRGGGALGGARELQYLRGG